jgi:hypothetical protein
MQSSLHKARTHGQVSQRPNTCVVTQPTSITQREECPKWIL